MFNKPASGLQFVEQKLLFSCSFRRDQFNKNHCFELGHTLLCCLSLTLVFIKPPSECRIRFFNKSLSLNAALHVTKFIAIIDMNWVTLCCASYVRLRCSTHRSQSPKELVVGKSLNLGVTKFTTTIHTILITLCCATIVRFQYPDSN